MDSSIAVVGQTATKRSATNALARSLTASLLIACIGVNTAFATSLERVASAPKDSVATTALYATDLANTSPDVLGQVVENLDEGALAELVGIYAEADASAAASSKAVDSQKSWKTMLAKAILKSSAFKAALRAASERAYIWYMGHIGPVLAGMDAVTSWSVNGITLALVAVGVPEGWAKIIARVLSFFL